jgi:cyclophilin family peptidyl-prolyl cis-trans isomerase
MRMLTSALHHLSLQVPVYEETLEDNGRFNEQPVLPFNAYGTVAMARSEFEANDGSSQFFFLLKVLM